MSTQNILAPQRHGLGLRKGVPTVLFMSGFPDVHKSFEKVFPSFATTHHVIVCIMPDYHKKKLAKRFGPTFPEIVDAMKQLLEEARAAEVGRITLVGHDWGSYVSQRFVTAHPTLVDKLVMLDVGLGVSPLHLPIVLFYQLSFTVIFVLSRIPIVGAIIGNFLMGKYFPAPLYNFLASLVYYVNPGPYETEIPFAVEDIRPMHCYPYFQFWSGMLTDKGTVPRFNKTIPTLFVYGKRKRIMFHVKRFLDKLDKLDGCEHHELDCGHWLQTQKPEELLAIMHKWGV